MLSTPAGKPASTKHCISNSAVAGTSEAGLKTTELPATSAGAIFQMGMAAGKFHGVIMAATPTGSFMV